MNTLNTKPRARSSPVPAPHTGGRPLDPVTSKAVAAPWLPVAPPPRPPQCAQQPICMQTEHFAKECETQKPPIRSCSFAVKTPSKVNSGAIHKPPRVTVWARNTPGIRGSQLRSLCTNPASHSLKLNTGHHLGTFFKPHRPCLFHLGSNDRGYMRKIYKEKYKVTPRPRTATAGREYFRHDYPY